MRLFYARFLIGGVLGLQPVDLRFGLLHSGLIAFEQRNEHGRRFAMGLRNFPSFVSSLPSAVCNVLITMVELDGNDS